MPVRDYLNIKKWAIRILGVILCGLTVTAQATYYGPIDKCVRIAHAPGSSLNKPGGLYSVLPEYGTTGSWTGATDTNYVNMNIPNPNVGNINFQPVGTVLSSAVKTFLEFAESGKFSPEQVLYKCPANAENSIYEMYSTNGDYRWGGREDLEVGLYFGMPGVYSTKIKGLGFRITNLSTGEHFSHIWKARPLRGLD
ncbi:hypothetical protein CAG53_02820, partial [Vibrio sp. V26_P1S5P106]|nr:hypothetical protein [Vibrio sp. V26_P1S5P106]